uniref:Uncharacterized protein n=1 Tax=Ananas comosus var. bracteatus TaxID=296719 RepID=A0A6V7P9B8_ANACO|nr:unnamed protein product [Ananas comosus var. bracteatus]
MAQQEPEKKPSTQAKATRRSAKEQAASTAQGSARSGRPRRRRIGEDRAASTAQDRFNKTLIKLLKKIIGKNQKEWHMRIIEALWAYRTTYRTPTQATPYSLVFSTEAVLPLEVELPSLRIAVQHELTNEENALLRLDEVSLTAQQNLELYQAQMASAYNKLTRYRTFNVRELVLALRRPIIINKHAGKKFDPNWEGPYVVVKAYEGGAYQLIDAKGERPMPPINGRFLKKYYA